MRSMIGICTDSNSQLPERSLQRYAVEVVPVTVTIDDHDYLEGVDLDADRFYEMLGAEPAPRVSTSHPSPASSPRRTTRCCNVAATRSCRSI